MSTAEILPGRQDPQASWREQAARDHLYSQTGGRMSHSLSGLTVWTMKPPRLARPRCRPHDARSIFVEIGTKATHQAKAHGEISEFT
jgi:hypothetical protein